MRENAGITPRVGATSLPYRSPLTHPLWWAALLLLVANDHVLKGSLAPGWLTGKLSDFAGMIVAPVLAAELLRARSSPRRLAAFSLVVVPFAAVNVSTDAADLLVRAAALVGLPWRIWTDPTDLVALLVLPLAWALSRGHLGASIRTGRVLPALRTLGAAMGGLACMATSTSAEEFETAAYLVNTTHDEIVFYVYRPEIPLDCASVADDPRSSLSPYDFAFDKCRATEPFVPLPLDDDWAEVTPDPQHQNPDPGPWRECDAVVVHALGMHDTAVFWSRLAKTRVTTQALHARVDKVEKDPHSVLVEQLGSVLLLGPGDALQAWEVDWALPAPDASCPEAP